jgi:peptide/nickel transport system permease protein
MHEPMHIVLRNAASRLLMIAASLVIAGVVSATLVRYAPGFMVDERELDSRLNSESIAAIRNDHQDQQHVLRFYATYLVKSLHGDFGTSNAFQQPISQLIKDRWLVTVTNIAGGLALAWAVALALALINVVVQQKLLEATLSVLLGAVLSLPAAVVALLIALAREPTSVAIAITLLPVIYRYARNILQNSWTRPWILGAFARGLGRLRILFSHVLPVAASELIALCGVSVTLAFSAAVPIEVLSDSPGLGQLAWQAAIGRDLPLIVTITGLVAALTLSANTAAALASEVLGPAHP